MFQILYPLGFLAAAGIAIPVIIHLWNIKSGKTLKIGSVFLLGTPTNQRSRSFRVQDWPLLLIRSLLILLVALLLASPVYFRSENAVSRPGWVLLDKTNFSKIWRTKHRKIDSLIKAGYEVHDLAVGFGKIDLKDTATIFSTPATGKLPYFALLRQLDRELPAGTSVYILAENQQRYFEGEKPVTGLRVQWDFLPLDTADLQWTASAYALQNGGNRKLEGQRTEGGNYYKASNILVGDETVSVDTSTIRIQINAGQNTSDAAYIRAAIQAIAKFNERKIVVENIKTSAQVHAQTKFLFWLNDKPISNQELRKLPKDLPVFSYEGGKVGKFRSEVLDMQGVAMKEVALYQKVLDVKSGGTPIWRDGTGMPILAMNIEGAVAHYRFYSRFKPEWTNLVWSDQMVLFLMPLILPESSAQLAFRDAAKLPVPADALQDTEQTFTSSKVEEQVVETELSSWIWGCLFLLFFLERWITYTKRKTVV